jgi:hypothetical protein
MKRLLGVFFYGTEPPSLPESGRVLSRPASQSPMRAGQHRRDGPFSV